MIMTIKEFSRRFITFAVSTTLTLLLCACGGGGSSSGSGNKEETESPPTAQKVSISLSTTELLYYGEKQAISLSLIYSDGSSEDITSSAEWAVDPTTVAKIEATDGTTYVHPLETGSATITASHQGLKDSIDITVSPYIHSIETVQRAITFPKNTAMPFLKHAHARVQGAPDFSILDDIIYTSSDPDIADFSGTLYSVIVHPDRSPLTGHLTPRSVGNTEVTLNYEGVDLGTREVTVGDYYLIGSDAQRLNNAPWFTTFGLPSNEKGDIALLTGSSSGQFTVDLQVFNTATNSLEEKFNVFQNFELKSHNSALRSAFSDNTVTLFWITPTAAMSANINIQTRQASFVTLSESTEDAFYEPNYLFKSESGSLMVCWLNTSVLLTQCKIRTPDGIWSQELIELPRDIRSLNANHKGYAALAKIIDREDGQKILQTHRFNFDEQPIEIVVEEIPAPLDAGGARRPAISATGSLAIPITYAPRRDEFDFNESGLQVATRTQTDGWSLQEIYAYGVMRVGTEIELSWSGERALMLVADSLGAGSATWLYSNMSWSEQESLKAIGFATPTLDHPPLPSNGSWVMHVPALDNFYLFCFDEASGWSPLDTFGPMAQWGDMGGSFSLRPSNQLALVWKERAAFGTEDGGYKNNSLTFFHPNYSDLSQCSLPEG